ncbi:MAG: ubiquinone/menaquinone biosynthesis C-methylase UbiE [Alphaproteobacteria bacterium]|jgi:ubiquinone/menaquinone biosynthesis C-methylase UbiE
MKHWDEYWATSNTVHSFSEGQYNKGYDGELRDIWGAIFKTMASSSVGLDIGCGNGGLALLGVQCRNDFNMYGCDAADIKPLESVDTSQEHFKMLSDITFFPKMKAEKLDFEDGHFDFAVSQFGIEYSDLTLSIPEVYRILKPNGRFIAMLHHQHSFVTQSSKTGLRLMAAFFSKGGIVEQLGDFVAFYNSPIFSQNLELKDNALTFKTYNIALLTAFKNLQKNNLDELSCEWYNDISKLLVPFIMSWQSHTEQDFKRTKRSLLQFNHRLTEQLKSAKSGSELQKIESSTEPTFSSFTYKPIRLKEGLFAWCIELIK